MLGELGADLSYHDPHVPSLRPEGIEMDSVALDDEVLERADIVCVVAAHSSVDYAHVADRAKLLLDFRNVVPEVEGKVERL